MRFGDEPAGGADWDRWPTSVTWARGRRALIVTPTRRPGPVFASIRPTATVMQLTSRRLHLHRRARRPGGVLYALRSSTRAAASGAYRPDGGHDRCARALIHAGCQGTLTEIDARTPTGRRRPVPVVAGATRHRRRRRRRCCCGSTAARWRSWNAWSLAVEPVAAGRAGLRGAAAGPGTVDRLRAGLHPARLGRMGWRTVHDLMAATDAACAHPRVDARAPRRWAVRSAATWPTGSPGTPTGSTRSSPMPACGRSTSSVPPPTASYYWLREMTRGYGRREFPAPVRRPDPHADAGDPRRQGLSRADR